MIKDIVENVVQNSEDRMISRIHESEGRMESRMESLISESENRMESKMDALISESEGRMESKMESLIHESENMVLGELDRVQVNLGKRIDKVEQNLDELNQYYRIIKLDHDNTAILLKTIGDHEKSIDALSKRVEVLENDKDQHRYEQHKLLRYRGDTSKRH